MRPRIEVLIALLLMQGAPIVAQERPSLAPGSRVRVHTAAAVPLTGRIIEAADSLLTVQAGTERIVVAAGDIRRLEVGTWRSGAGKGAKVGALVGGLVGLAASVALMSESDGFIDYGPEALPAGIFGGAFMGVGIGVVIGALSSREVWTTVPGPAVAVAPATAGTGVGLRIQF
jgi:hypothetical protein